METSIKIRDGFYSQMFDYSKPEVWVQLASQCEFLFGFDFLLGNGAFNLKG